MEQDEPRLNRPRISVEISEEEQTLLQDHIPWGLQSAIVRTLVRGAINIIEEYGEVGIAALITGKVSTLDVLRALERSKKDGTG